MTATLPQQDKQHTVTHQPQPSLLSCIFGTSIPGRYCAAGDAQGGLRATLLSPFAGTSPHTSLLSTNSKTRLSSQGSKEKQHREEETGEEQHGEPGPSLARQGPASRAMPPRAAGRRSPPTRFRGHRPRCQGVFPRAYPSCSSPVPAQSMPRQTGSGPRPDTDDSFFLARLTHLLLSSSSTAEAPASASQPVLTPSRHTWGCKKGTLPCCSTGVFY